MLLTKSLAAEIRQVSDTGNAGTENAVTGNAVAMEGTSLWLPTIVACSMNLLVLSGRH